MVIRREITDAAWEQIEPLLPKNGRKGSRWRDHRTVIDGILWKLRTGAPWRDLPERYGPWQSCFDRFNRWRRDGTWDRLLEHAQTKSDAVGEVEWEVSVDDTVVRAHSTPRGLESESVRKTQKGTHLREPDEALGRSRGGLSTKIHLICDGKGRPLSVLLTPGQRHGSTRLGTLLDAIRVPRLGQGRSRKRPERLIADKGYDFSTCRGLLRHRSIAHVIPRRREREGHHASRVGRRAAFDRDTYARRNVVERCVNRLKQWRGIATRYEKRAANYRAMVVIASLIMWLPS